MSQTPEAIREAVRKELGRHGSLTTIDDRGVLATIMPGIQEGHFRVDHEADGSWRLWGTYQGENGEVRVSGPVSGNALAALAGEYLLETRHRYCTEFGHPVPPPLPPPAIRARKKEYLAEETMQRLTGGTLPAAGNHGFDVLAGGRRIQVKASVRNPKSGLISTLQFKTAPGYKDHDELVYVEFSPDNYPLRAWSIESDLFRSIVPDDRKTHHVEPILQQHGTDITEPFVAAFESLYMSSDPEDRRDGLH